MIFSEYLHGLHYKIGLKAYRKFCRHSISEHDMVMRMLERIKVQNYVEQVH